MLYVDILAYKEYLISNSISVDYIKKLEASIEKIVLDVLNSKIIKTKYDESLIKLFEALYKASYLTPKVAFPLR